jgi:exodeoxyribonuclease VII large subunit
MRDRDVEELRWSLRHAALARHARLGARFETLRRRLEQRDVRRVTAGLATRVVRAEGRLREIMTRRHHVAEAAAGRLAARLDALSPLSVLGRGYAVCWNDARTSIIRAASAVQPGDHVRVTLADGELACRVEDALDGAGHPGPRRADPS